MVANWMMSEFKGHSPNLRLLLGKLWYAFTEFLLVLPFLERHIPGDVVIELKVLC